VLEFEQDFEPAENFSELFSSRHRFKRSHEPARQGSRRYADISRRKLV
jgi:hypothetical protein